MYKEDNTKYAGYEKVEEEGSDGLALATYYREIINGEIDYSEQELSDILKEVDCYVNGGDEICTKNVIENNQHLKLITFMGTGYEKYIDVNIAK